MCITPSYPPPHPVTIMPIATGTLANQNTLPTTVGMMEKKPSSAMQLTPNSGERCERIGNSP